MPNDIGLPEILAVAVAAEEWRILEKIAKQPATLDYKDDPPVAALIACGLLTVTCEGIELSEAGRSALAARPDGRTSVPGL